MAPVEGSRPGGRSARIQQSVHAATRDLLATVGRDGLTIPLIAGRAGVNPTTLYRRWGDLAALLSDVATDHFRQTDPPPVTGSLEGDLRVWAVQFQEEMGSRPGRSYVADVISGDADGQNAGACARYTASTVSEILARFPERDAPSADDVLDHVVAPILYRVLFARDRPLDGYAEQLVDSLLSNTDPAALAATISA